MIFRSQEKRIWWLMLLGATAFDFSLCYLIAWWFSGGGESVPLVAVFLYIGLQIVGTVLSFKTMVYRFIAAKLGHTKIVADNLHSFLVTNKFPPPRQFETSAEDYLSRVALDEEQSIDVRIASASELGQFRGIRASGFTSTILASMAYEDAIKRLGR